MHLLAVTLEEATKCGTLRRENSFKKHLKSLPSSISCRWRNIFYLLTDNYVRFASYKQQLFDSQQFMQGQHFAVCLTKCIALHRIVSHLITLHKDSNNDVA